MAKITRRRLLSTAAASALGLPFLGSAPSAASEAGFPLRIIFYFTPNEWIDRSHWDVGYGLGESGPLPAALPSILSDLDPFRQKLTMVGDLYMKSRDFENHPGGHIGTGHVLTGRKVDPYGSSENEFYATGESLDQMIARRLGCDVLYSAVRPGALNGHGRISYFGANEPDDPHLNPFDAFNDVFAQFTEPPDIIDAKREQRRHVLDAVAGNLTRVQTGLPSEDRMKLESHLDSINDLQADLDETLELACNGVPTGPNADASYGDGGNGKIPATHRMHMDVITEALKCGTTQVATLQFGGAASQYITPTWGTDPVNPISIPRDLHNISHDYNTAQTNQQYIDRRIQIEQWYARQFQYFLQRLDGVPEGDETLLDHSIVVWCKELGRGHGKDSHLYLLAGGGCGQLQTDRFVSFPDAPHSNLLVSLANMMGLDDVDTFGDPEVMSQALNL